MYVHVCHPVLWDVRPRVHAPAVGHGSPGCRTVAFDGVRQHRYLSGMAPQRDMRAATRDAPRPPWQHGEIVAVCHAFSRRNLGTADLWFALRSDARWHGERERGGRLLVVMVTTAELSTLGCVARMAAARLNVHGLRMAK